MGARRPTVGVFSPFIGGFYFGSMLKGMADAAYEAGARLIAVQTLQSGLTHAPERDPLPMHHRVAWDHMAGCIAVVNAVGPDYLKAFQDTGRPVVMISNEFPTVECATVLPDNRGGVREAVRHLIEHGHRRIAFAGYLAQEDIRERHAAFEEALRAAGIEPDPTLLFDTGDHMQSGGRLAGQRMLAASLPSTAVFAATDFNAFGLMSELTEAGVRLPEGQAIVGFDGMDMAAYSNPSLTTVEQDFTSIGETAVAVLLGQIASGETGRSRTYVPTRLSIRESCGCADVVLPVVASTPVAGLSAHDIVMRALEASGESAVLTEKSGAGDTHAAHEVIAAAVVAALTDGDQPTSIDVKQALEVLYRARPFEATSVIITEAVRSSAKAIALVEPVEVAGQLRFADLLVSMAHWLAGAEVSQQFARNHKLQALMLAQYEVSMDLLRNDGNDLHQLAFLERTAARGGILALWTGTVDAWGNAMLEIAGSYDRSRKTQRITGFVGAVDEFPPESVLALADVTSDVVHIAPTWVKSSDWGLLALVAPIETSVSSGREAINQWAALLTVALDAQQTLDSLNEQRETLAAALARESQLVEDFRNSQERYILATQAANGGLWDWDLVTGVIYYASRWKTLAGYRDEDIDDTPEAWISRVHPEDRPGLLESLDRLMRGDVVTIEHEHRLRRADGTYRWMFCRALAVLGDDDTATRLVGSLTDIHERKELEDRLRQAALHDGLTGLGNRTLFLERLGEALALSRGRRSSQFAVLFMDLDGFKAVNDSLGHLAGDQLLIQAAQRIQRSLRGADVAARMGGDEFAVLVAIHSPEDAELVAERVQQLLSRPFEIEGQEVLVSTSIGVARSSTGYDTPEDVLRDADLEMYRAKIAQRESRDHDDADRPTTP
jgi:diguanylate cyclase (GGDEF)-like protein/PAS domain S-box-containing protein